MKYSERLLLTWILALVALMFVSNEALAEHWQPSIGSGSNLVPGRGWAYSPRPGIWDSDLRPRRESIHCLRGTFWQYLSE